MRLLELRPMLQTTDYKGTIDFYTKVLGFTITSQMEQLGWASLTRDEISIMISRPFDSHTILRTGLYRLALPEYGRR